jgi:5'(3')-deoxyribonucleotidase
LKVALDFDNVLANTMIWWIKYYNKKYRASLTKDDIHTWEFWKQLPISKEEAYAIFDSVWSDWKNLPPTEENIANKVDEIKNIAEVDIVTAVKEIHVGDLTSWLSDRSICYHKLVPCDVADKSRLGYHIFIDDSPALAHQLELSRESKMCFLYDQPWNHNITGKKITRVRDLAEAKKLIKTVEKKKSSAF